MRARPSAGNHAITLGLFLLCLPGMNGCAGNPRRHGANLARFRELTEDMVQSMDDGAVVEAKGILAKPGRPLDPQPGETEYRILIPESLRGGNLVILSGPEELLARIWSERPSDRDTVWIAFRGVLGAYPAEYQNDPSRDPWATLSRVEILGWVVEDARTGKPSGRIQGWDRLLMPVRLPDQ